MSGSCSYVGRNSAKYKCIKFCGILCVRFNESLDLNAGNESLIGREQITSSAGVSDCVP